jgi:serine/threonine protein kinase
MKDIIKSNRDKWTYRQVKILTQIKQHPNIITLHGLIFHKEEDRMPSLLYEYVETKSKFTFPKNGKHTVSKMIEKGPYFKDLNNVRSFMRSLLGAIDFMNSKGVMHRDLKPNNIMMNKYGEVKVVDFDLAEFYSPKYPQ